MSGKFSFFLDEKERMGGAKILAMFDEFSFLHRYADNPLRLYSVKVSRVDEDFLNQRAEGSEYDNPIAANEGTSACQTRNFVFLDLDGKEIGYVRPWTWIRAVWIRKLLERSFFILPPSYRSSGTLLEELQRGEGLLGSVCYIVETLEEGYEVKVIIVHKKPQGRTLLEMVNEWQAEHRAEIA